MRCNTLISKTSWHRILFAELQSYVQQFFLVIALKLDGHWIDAAALRVSANQLKKGWILFLITIDVYTVAAFWFPSHHVFFCVKRQTETNFAICTAKLRTNSICTFKEIKPIISVVQLKEKAVMLRCASHASIFSFFTINQSASRGHGKFTATPKINFFLH